MFINFPFKFGLIQIDFDLIRVIIFVFSFLSLADYLVEINWLRLRLAFPFFFNLLNFICFVFERRIEVEEVIISIIFLNFRFFFRLNILLDCASLKGLGILIFLIELRNFLFLLIIILMRNPRIFFV